MDYATLKAKAAIDANVSAAAADAVIRSVIYSVTHELACGAETRIPGLGTFRPVDRQAKEGRNPQTGDTIRIAARRVPKFSAAKAMKEALSPQPQSRRMVGGRR